MIGQVLVQEALLDSLYVQCSTSLTFTVTSLTRSFISVTFTIHTLVQFNGTRRHAVVTNINLLLSKCVSLL